MKSISYSFARRLAVYALAGGIVVGGSAYAFARLFDNSSRHEPVKIPLAETPIPRDGMPRGSYAAVVKKVAPGVVKIETTMRLHAPSTQGFPGFNDPFWRRFFGHNFGPLVPPQHWGPQIEEGIGSGVIVTKNGYILTNNHVVDGASKVEVFLADGREFKARVIGRDPKTDLAVVKIDAHDLPVVPFADSKKVEVGDVVLAVGNPFGVGETVTQGIVSAKNRGDMHIEDYEDFIQTDAAINPGNSGGALVDIEGRLIGINTAILTRSGGSQGVGFAIPSDLARSVMESLIQYGHVTRGYLGVTIQNVTPALGREFDMKGTAGALIGGVLPDTPAAKAGFKAGDVIVKFNGTKIKSSRQLQLQVAGIKPGSKVPVEVIRDGKTRTLEVKVGELPGRQQLASANAGNQGNNGTLNGVTVADLNQDTRAQYHIPKDVHGAVIVQVDPDSASAQAGLQPGDVIQSINRHPVRSANDAVRLTEHPKSERTLVRVWAKGGSQFVVVDEGKNAG